MDDPDVDLELIALLRQSLGISSKGEDTISCETGKITFFFRFCVTRALSEGVLFIFCRNSSIDFLH